MMKKILVAILIIGAFVGVSYIEHNYTRDNCVVIEASETGCLIRDEVGEQWYWEGEGFEVGDEVKMKMFDNLTSAYIVDDEIKEVIKK